MYKSHIISNLEGLRLVTIIHIWYQFSIANISIAYVDQLVYWFSLTALKEQKFDFFKKKYI